MRGFPRPGKRLAARCGTRFCPGLPAENACLRAMALPTRRRAARTAARAWARGDLP